MSKISLSWNDRIREFLMKKLLQYLSRMFDPAENESSRIDATFKAGILQTLLNKEAVSYVEVEAMFHYLTRGRYDDRALQKAWDVIEGYNLTGGSNLRQRSDQAIPV